MKDSAIDTGRVATAMIATLAPVDSLGVEKLKLSRVEQDAYSKVLRELDLNEKTRHQVLGYAQPVQNDMQVDCHIASHDLPVGVLGGHYSARAQAVAEGGEAWQLLLQLDSDDNPGMMWGDTGMLYFFTDLEGSTQLGEHHPDARQLPAHAFLVLGGRNGYLGLPL